MRTRIILAIVFSASASILFGIFSYFERTQAIETWYIDRLFRIRGPKPPPQSVVVLALDEESYQYFDIPISTRWPRHLHAKLLRRLARAGAAGVAFDVLFLGASESPTEDDEFANEFSSIPVTLGAELSRINQSEGILETVREPYEPFRQQVRSIGLVNLFDDNGQVRRFMESGAGYEPLALAAVGSRAKTLPAPDDLLGLYGPARTITTYSLYQVLQDEVPFPDDILRGKLIFVGLSLRAGLADARKDAFTTSFYARGAVFGVELHANAAANLIEESWISRLPRNDEVLWGVLALMTASLLVTLAPPLFGGVGVVVLLAGWSGVAFFSFSHGFLLPGFSALWFGLPTGFLMSTVANYSLVRRDREKIRKAFSFYLSPNMAKEVSKNPDALRLGGHEVVATALFTDLAGFTSISETMRAEDTAKMLNRYFSKVALVVTKNEGTLIKFIGDAIFALWGLPSTKMGMPAPPVWLR